MNDTLRKNSNVKNADLRQGIEQEGEPLLLRQEGGRLQVTFNRSERRNALNDAMLLALDRLIARLETDSSVRVVIFRGAGGDIKERRIQTASAHSGSDSAMEQNIQAGKMFLRLSRQPWPWSRAMR